MAVSQQKVEATSENNAASNHSNDYAACMRENKGFSEKGSDAQVSLFINSALAVNHIVKGISSASDMIDVILGCILRMLQNISNVG